MPIQVDLTCPGRALTEREVTPMTMHTITARHDAPITGTTRPLWRRVLLWWSLNQERHALGKLDKRMLADIGIDEATAVRESIRPMWDVPDNRRLSDGRRL